MHLVQCGGGFRNKHIVHGLTLILTPHSVQEYSCGLDGRGCDGQQDAMGFTLQADAHKPVQPEQDQRLQKEGYDAPQPIGAREVSARPSSWTIT